jgi:uncharacterized protein (DUF1015 family)
MEIRPFEIVHYPLEKNLLERVVCPPYDKFTNEEIAAFREKDPYNFVWTILGDTLENHSYHEEAAKTLRDWVKDNVLVREPKDKFLVYRQKYTSPLSGDEMTRSGFYGLLRLPERDEKAVLPHERTFSEHKADRLSLYQEVRGTPEGIFVLYSDPDGKVRRVLEAAKAEVDFQDFNDQGNELSFLEEEEAIRTVRSVVEPQTLLIADGHHRFETGQNYRDECRAANPEAAGAQPWDYILVYFAALEDPGLVILPTHRVLKEVSRDDLEKFLNRARDFFDIEEQDPPVDPQAIQGSILEVHSGDRTKESFGLVTRDKIRILRLRDPGKLKTLLPGTVAPALRDLPVVWLHQVILEQLLAVRLEDSAPDRIAYVRTGKEVYDRLAGGYDLAFLLRGTHPEEVRKAAESGERMPQKSTDFYPKILSGLAAYLHP